MKKFPHALAVQATILLLVVIFPIFASNLFLTRADTSNIQFGQTVSATINPVGDIDSYKFLASAGDPIYIRMRAAFSNGLKPQIRLYGPNGLEIERNGGDVVSASISCVLNESGEYTVLALDNSGQKIGSYGILVYNFNNQDLVPFIQYEESIAGSTDFVGDTNCYRLSAMAGDSILIRAGGNQGTPEYWLMLLLYHANGTRIAQTSGGQDLTAELSYTINETNTYVVMLFCNTLVNIGSDDLNVKGPGNLINSYNMVIRLLTGPAPPLTPTLSPSPTISQPPDATPINSQTPSLTPTQLSPSPSPTSNPVNDVNQFNPLMLLLVVSILAIVVAVVVVIARKVKKGNASTITPGKAASNLGVICCKYCGAENPSTFEFCGQCSHPLKDEETKIY